MKIPLRLPKPSSTIVGVTMEKRRGGGSHFFGRATYRPGGSCGPRIQRMFQLVVLLRGQMSVRTRDGVCEVEPGHGVLLKPSYDEMLQFGQESAVHTWCELNPSVLTRAERRILNNCHGAHAVSGSIHVYIEEGLAVSANISGKHLYAMTTLARACLLRFAADVSSFSNEVPVHRALLRASDILSTHFMEINSAAELARRAGVSVIHLRRLFKAAGKESPTTMLWRLKAEHALQMIRSTGLGLAEIAEQCGYANPFHLSRYIKQIAGLSPRELRKREWAETQLVKPQVSKRS